MTVAVPAGFEAVVHEAVTPNRGVDDRGNYRIRSSSDSVQQWIEAHRDPTILTTVRCALCPEWVFEGPEPDALAAQAAHREAFHTTVRKPRPRAPFGKGYGDTT